MVLRGSAARCPEAGRANRHMADSAIGVPERGTGLFRHPAVNWRPPARWEGALVAAAGYGAAADCGALVPRSSRVRAHYARDPEALARYARPDRADR